MVYLDEDARRLVMVGVDESRGLVERRQHRLIGLGVLVAELRGREDRAEAGRTADDVVGAQYPVDLRVLQFLVLEGRAGEMTGDLGAPGQERGGTVGMGQVYGQRIELELLPRTEGLLGGHFPRDRLIGRFHA